MHQMILGCIPDPLMEIMNQRNEEGYDINDETALGTVRKIFKVSHKMVSNPKHFSNVLNSAINDKSACNTMEMDSANSSTGSSKESITSSEVVNEEISSNITDDHLLMAGPSLAGPSAILENDINNEIYIESNHEDSDAETSYVSLDFSPFKSHNIISSDVIITLKLILIK